MAYNCVLRKTDGARAKGDANGERGDEPRGSGGLAWAAEQ
jgi:hypothetical protein